MDLSPFWEKLFCKIIQRVLIRQEMKFPRTENRTKETVFLPILKHGFPTVLDTIQLDSRDIKARARGSSVSILASITVKLVIPSSWSYRETSWWILH